jgi:hopanoid biosynthesis associated RND transporter like protein HpnN
MMSFSNSTFARLLRPLGRVVSKGPWWFVYPQILLALLGLLYATKRLEMDTNRSHLAGAGAKYQQIQQAYHKEFPGVEDELVVAVESEQRELNRQFIERLAAAIEPETNLFRDLFYKGDLATLGPKALLLVPTKDLEQMRQSLSQYRPLIQEFTEATNLNSLFALVNQQFRTAPAAKTAATTSLINAIPFLQSIVSQATQSLSLLGAPPSPGVEALFTGGEQAKQKGYVTLDKGRVYLLTVRARTEALQPAAIERLRDLIGQVEIEVPGVDVGLTGGPVLDYDEMHQAKHDTTLASLVALALCSAIFIAAYRQVRRPLKAALCLLIGLGYSLAFATLAVGHLNVLTITFAPMLIGLAIDFGIHFTTRFEEELRRGRPETEAVSKATVFTGQGIVTGAFTTAAAFLAMALTHFKGIREMGIISGGGLLLCLVPMMTALPVLLLRGPENPRDRQQGYADARRVRIENLWLQRPALVISLTVLLCAGAALEFHKVFFDYNLLDMQSQGLPSVIHEKLLIRHTGGSAVFGAVVADSMDQARAFEDKLKHLPAVAGARSAADLISEDQDRKLEFIRAIQAELAGIRFAPMDRSVLQLEPLSATLWYLVGYLGAAGDATQNSDPALAERLLSLRDAITGLRIAMLSGQPEIPRQLTEFQQAFLDDLHQTLKDLQTQDAGSPLRPQDLPPALRNRFIGITGKYLVQVYPRNDLWQHENQREFIRELRSAVPPDDVTGMPVGLYEYTTLLKNSYQQAALYALGAIAIMVLLHFQSLTCLLLALLPVAIGTTWLLGFMGATGTPFNPANIMTLPLIVGIGVTNGIQILNRFAEEQKPGILARSTGKAVLVSGLTAIAGFGSLMLAKHQGIRSLGIVMSVGLATCLVAALSFLPALMGLLWKRGWTIKLRPEVHK